MTLGTLCEGNDLIAISSDINNALKYLNTSLVGNTSQSSLLSRRAKIEHANRDDRAAIEDLDKAIHADLDKALEFSNSGGVAPEKTASVCVWTEPEGWARRFFENWRASLKWQRLKPYEKFAEMIDRHWDGIAAYCRLENKVSLGFVEGLNNKVRVIQRRSYGLRNEEYLRLKILTCMLPVL